MALAAVPAAAARDAGVVVSTGDDVPGAVAPDGSARYDLPWLRPGDRDVAVSPDGTAMAFTSSGPRGADVWVADLRTGAVARRTATPEPERRPAWSPDGRFLAWDVPGADGRHVVVAGAAEGAPVRLTSGTGDEAEATWSPDGGRIAFTAAVAGGRVLRVAGLAGGGTTADVPLPPGRPSAPAWSPDGVRIAVALTASGGRRTHVWTVEPGTGRAVRLTSGPVRDTRPEFSPDGRRIAFGRVDRNGTAVHVVPAGGGTVRPVPGTLGTGDPDWSAAAASLVPTPELLPDLDQRAPTDLRVVFTDGAWRLGFTSWTENLGDGPLRIRGTRDRADSMRADQLVALRGGGVRVLRGIGRLRYEDHPPHRHWHLASYVTYSLRSVDGPRREVRDRKSGFCLIDRWERAITRVPGVRPPRFTGDCGARNPGARRVEQGTSRGYADVYPAFFHGQDIALTGLPAGRYALVHRANPGARMRELRHGNNVAAVLVRLSWPRGPREAPRVRVLRRCERGTCGA
jgi:hypothetical protein